VGAPQDIAKRAAVRAADAAELADEAAYARGNELYEQLDFVGANVAFKTSLGEQPSDEGEAAAAAPSGESVSEPVSHAAAEGSAAHPVTASETERSPVITEPAPAAPDAVAVGARVDILDEKTARAALEEVGMKLNPARKKHCGTRGIVESLLPCGKIKVKFEAAVAGRVDTSIIVWPLAALRVPPVQWARGLCFVGHIAVGCKVAIVSTAIQERRVVEELHVNRQKRQEVFDVQEKMRSETAVGRLKRSISYIFPEEMKKTIEETKQFIEADVMPEVGVVVRKFQENTELASTSSELSDVARQFLSSTTGFTEAKQLLVTADRAGEPYTVVKAAAIRKGSDPASQRMGTLRPGALVFASETVTLVDGRVRVCIGESQWTTVKTLNKKSGEGKVLLVPISLKTAKGTVDASKLLSSSTALLKQTLAKTSGDNLDDALDDMNWQRDELETKIETVLAGAEGLLGGDALEIWRKTSSAIGRTREAISDDSSSANTTIVSTAGRAAEALKSSAAEIHSPGIQKALQKGQDIFADVSSTTEMVKLQRDGAAIFGNARTPQEVIHQLQSNPQFVSQIKTQVICFIEDAVAGASIPDVSGDKSWGSYKIEGLIIKKLKIRQDSLGVAVERNVQITVKGLKTSLEKFGWAFDKTSGFPRMKDTGTADATLSGLAATVSFELVTSSESALSVENLQATLKLASMDVMVHESAQGGTRKWLYNKLISAFRDRIRTDVEAEMKVSPPAAAIASPPRVKSVSVTPRPPHLFCAGTARQGHRLAESKARGGRPRLWRQHRWPVARRQYREPRPRGGAGKVHR
jgi:hypothetical protein